MPFKNMPSPLTNLTVTISATGLRYLPMGWAPRWLNGYTTQSDALRKLLFSSCTYHLDRARYYAHNYTRSAFFGSEGESRTGYVAQHHFAKDYVPAVVIVGSMPQLITTTVYEADSLGTLLHEELHPVFWRDGAGAMLLKNLDMVHYQITSASGVLDLTSALASHPRQTDSPVIVANAWDDRQILDPVDSRWLSTTTLQVLQDDTYDVYWQSSRLCTALLSASSYITIGGETVYVKPYVFYNSWDAGLKKLGLLRLDRESNREFKTRFQHYVLAKYPDSLLSSALGEARAFVWNPQDTWSLSGSGSLRIEPLNVPQYEYRSEELLRSGAAWLFTQTPSGLVHVFHNFTFVEADEYTVSGNVLAPLTQRLQQAQQGQVRAVYRVMNYTLTTSGSYVQRIGPAFHSPGLHYVLVSRNVQLVRQPKRVRQWRWGNRPDDLLGTSQFG